MLLNEFLKEPKAFLEQQHRVQEQDCKIQEQATTIAELKKEMEIVVAHSKEQDSKIQKVSTQIEMNRASPRVANKSQ